MSWEKRDGMGSFMTVACTSLLAYCLSIEENKYLHVLPSECFHGEWYDCVHANGRLAGILARFVKDLWICRRWSLALVVSPCLPRYLLSCETAEEQ